MPRGAVSSSSAASSLPPTPRNTAYVKVPQQHLTSEALRAVVLAANSDGIGMLRRGRAAAAFEQLKYAEAVLVANPEASAQEMDLMALTCSNLGCYYRKAGLPRAALKYLHRALKLEETTVVEANQDACSLATTKLNTCAALSGVGCHEEAERLAMEATRLLVFQASSDSGLAGQEESALLAVACHNLGAEREHLGRWASAAVAFRQGAEIASRALGPSSDMARALTTSCGEALQRAEKHPVTPERPSTSRTRGAAPRRPWLRNAGLAATSSGGTSRQSSRRTGRSLRSAPPMPMPPSPIDLADWGVAMSDPMANVEPLGSGMEADSVAAERPCGSRQGTLVTPGDAKGLDDEQEQDQAMQDLHSLYSIARNSGGIEREHSVPEDWGEMPPGGAWRTGAGRVRVMSPEGVRGAQGHSHPASVVASPRQSLVMQEAPLGKPHGGLSSRRRENSGHGSLHGVVGFRGS